MGRDTGMDSRREASPAEVAELAAGAVEPEATDMDMARGRMGHATTYVSIPSSTTRLTTTSMARWAIHKAMGDRSPNKGPAKATNTPSPTSKATPSTWAL